MVWSIKISMVWSVKNITKCGMLTHIKSGKYKMRHAGECYNVYDSQYKLLHAGECFILYGGKYKVMG